MARVRGLTSVQKIEYQKDDLAKKCNLILFRNNISKAELARICGITPQAIHKQFQNKQLTMQVLIAIVSIAKDVDADEVFSLIKAEGL